MAEKDNNPLKSKETSHPLDPVPEQTVRQTPIHYPDHPLWNMFFRNGKNPLLSRDFDPDDLNEEILE